MNTAEQIKEILEATGWTMNTLAKRLGVTPSNVSRWLKGREPRKEAVASIQRVYDEVFNPVPQEAPENLDVIVEKDEKTTLEIADELEPTSFEKLNPPDISAIDQTPVQAGYVRFLENLRFFMQDSRWDTPEKLEAYLNLKPGYIDSFGSHEDRFEECKIMNDICDLLGVPWSILAFSNVAKEDRLARLTFKVEQAKEDLIRMIEERNDLANELNVPEIDATIVRPFPFQKFIANSVENIKRTLLAP